MAKSETLVKLQKVHKINFVCQQIIAFLLIK